MRFVPIEDHDFRAQFVRAGDVLAAVLVFVSANLLHLSTRGFAATTVALVSVWIFIAFRVGRSFTNLRRENVSDD